MFYNTENLFDTIDNHTTIDEDFTPIGRLKYDSERYHTKIEHTARVINEAVLDGMPEIIGLAEIENTDVLHDLVSKLNNSSDYSVHVGISRDIRGIENALITHSRFKSIKLETHNIDLDEERPTRPILALLLEDTETKIQYWVMVNHWPSRYGGVEASNWKRVRALETLSAAILKYRQNYPDAKIVVMGDFNDDSTTDNIKALSKCETDSDPCLINTHAHIDGTGRGSYAYQGEWNMLDQIMVDKQLIDGSNLTWTKENAGDIVVKDWMLYESTKYDDFLPTRTYAGNRYYGGYSDHLPVILPFYNQR
ncbi:MAG: endonuclease [Salibacteraceae bacterium]